jgi:hypothetical protein
MSDATTESAARILLAKERRELIETQKREAFERHLQVKEDKSKQKLLEKELCQKKYVSFGFKT